MEPPRGRGRPRRAEADAAILEAAASLLREGGYRALSLDEVARRAGTAKTSIYRRWSSKAALAAEVVGRGDASADADPVRAFASLLEGEFGDVVAALIGEAQENAETRTIIRDLLRPYLTPLGDAAPAALGAILFRRLIR